MSWINIISYEAAEGMLKRLYDRIKNKEDNNIDNVMMVHSLRPHTLEGHLKLYKNALHHANNTLPKWYVESLGVYVSRLNHCDYCVEHHSAGLERLLEDEIEYNKVAHAIMSGELTNAFEGKYLVGMQYARQLTVNPVLLQPSKVDQLREHGFSDGEVLEINQIVSYFNYGNRTVLGLGVTTEGDILGLSPNSENEDDFTHQ